MTEYLPPVIFVIDENTVLRTTTSNTLERNGFIVSSKPTPEEAIELISTLPNYHKPQVIIIGNASFEQAKKNSEKMSIYKSPDQSPLMIFISNEAGEQNIGETELKGYFHEVISRPFSQLDLTNRLKELLGIHHIQLRHKVVSFKNIKMDLMSYRVVKNNREVHLGPTEFKILHYFLDNPTKVFSRKEIMEYVWGEATMELRTVDVHINRLRTALSEPGKIEPSIKTVRSAGYCLQLPETH